MVEMRTRSIRAHFLSFNNSRCASQVGIKCFILSLHNLPIDYDILSRSGVGGGGDFVTGLQYMDSIRQICHCIINGLQGTCIFSFECMDFALHGLNGCLYSLSHEPADNHE